VSEETAPPEVEKLWNQITKLEDERRFDGEPYPEDMAPFPDRLTGRTFFPGGDGLWRDDASLTSLKGPSTSPFPVGGIMFLANDWGTLRGFESIRRKGYSSMSTWRNLKQRLTAAGICGKVGFYTNAYLGIRTKKNAIDSLDWSDDKKFREFCGEFLRFQLETMRPCLLVVLGQSAKEMVCLTLTEIPELAAWKSRKLSSLGAEESIRVVEWRGRKLVVHVTSHPYSDIKKDEAAKAAEAERAERLKQAWETAKSR